MRLLLTAVLLLASHCLYPQSPAGKWRKVSHETVYEGKKMDTYAALLSVRPCAGKIVYEINADRTFRLNAAASGCDDNYRNAQEKLYAKTKWKLEGNKLSLSATNFAISQVYTVTFSGSRMIWTGTEGQGVITYEKLR